MNEEIYMLSNLKNSLLNERHSIMNKLDYWVGCEKEEERMNDEVRDLTELIYSTEEKMKKIKNELECSK